MIQNMSVIQWYVVLYQHSKGEAIGPNIHVSLMQNSSNKSPNTYWPPFYNHHLDDKSSSLSIDFLGFWTIPTRNYSRR